jgi:hypothetical protein
MPWKESSAMDGTYFATPEYYGSAACVSKQKHEIEYPKGRTERIADSRPASAPEGVCLANAVRHLRIRRCSSQCG